MRMENRVHILDLQFQDAEETIGAFLIQSGDGLVLVETGPESTFPVLKKKVEALGYKLSDIRHVLLSHIHFDHAGAAWRLAQLGARIYVHPVGLPHLASPGRLWDSASQIYGADNMARLWGSMEPISERSLIPVEHGKAFDFGGIAFTAWHTPGHASHHVAWQFEGALFTGDVAGVKISGGPVVPPCPPPDIHLERWKESIELIRKLSPTRLYLTHFGVAEHVEDHLRELVQSLDDWAFFIKDEFDQGASIEDATPRFMEYTRLAMVNRDVTPSLRALYEYANPSWMSVTGLMRYWKMKSQGRL
jgi:glyoxylase-like metal-dependent hydrolase (beta-lactamase superfamily II)